MTFFTSQDVALGTKLLEIIYIIMGLITFYTGIKNALDKENPSRFGTRAILVRPWSGACVWTLDPAGYKRGTDYPDDHTGHPEKSKDWKCRTTDRGIYQ